MKNLAGNKDCDKQIIEELEEAGVEFASYESLRHTSEVESSIIGSFDGFTFRRAWSYWVVSSNKTLLRFQYADILHEKFGNEVRVDGHCACPSPREWLWEPYWLGVGNYHVDTQRGLNALVASIKQQTAENI